MKLTPNYIPTNKIGYIQNAQSFTSNAEKPVSTEPQITSLSNVTQDYAVRTPIAYSHVEDINLTDGITAKCYKLANGQKVVIVPKDGPTFVKSYVNTGSFNEPDHLRGISHYIEHNLFNGSEDLGDKVFFDEVNKMGADTNASTSFSTTDYFIQSNLLEDTDLETKIQLHAGMLQSPKFLLEKLEKEKNIVNSEINMCVSEDENIGFSQTIKNLYNIKSTSLDLIAGTTDNITALTRDDVVNYFKSNYYPANMVTVITGEVEPDKTMELVSKYFTASNNPVYQRHFEKMTPIDKPIRQDIISQKTQADNATIMLGFAGPENNNTKDRIHMQALSYLFGGLGNSRVSALEKEYGTGIGIFPEKLSSRPEDRNMMIIETSVPDSKVESMLKDIYSVIHNLAQNPPTADEMVALKNRMKKAHNDMFESNGAINNYLGHQVLNGTLGHIKDFNTIVDEMTSADISNIAKKYLDLNKVALTVVHPNSASKETIESNHKLVSSISFTGANKKTPIDISNISHYRMNNNLEVIFNDTPTDNVFVKMTIQTKDWTPRKAAVADILNSMFNFAGTNNKTHEQLLKNSDMLALDESLRASQYGVSASAKFTVDNTEKSLAQLRERIQEPNFSQEEFELAIARLKDAYNSVEVSPTTKFNKVMMDNTPYQFSAKDKLESLNSITLEDVKALYNDTFVNGQGHVVVAGPVSKHPELKDIVFNNLATFSKVQPLDIEEEKLYKPVDKTVVLTDVNKKNQANIIMGYKFKDSENIKDKAAIAIMQEILGGSPSSRLFMDLRESRNLAYSVYSDCFDFGDLGFLTLHIGTTTENQETGEKTFDNVKKSIDGFNENIQRIVNEKVSDEELETAKKAIKNCVLNSVSSNAGKAMDIFNSRYNPYGFDSINRYYDILDSITPEDVQAAAKYIFSGKPVYSLTATQATLDANKEYLSTLGEWA